LRMLESSSLSMAMHVMHSKDLRALWTDPSAVSLGTCPRAAAQSLPCHCTSPRATRIWVTESLCAVISSAEMPPRLADAHECRVADVHVDRIMLVEAQREQLFFQTNGGES